MKTIKDDLIQTIADFSGFVPSTIEIVRDFRISENQKNFERVFLVHDFAGYFYVIWRWTTMSSYCIKSFNKYKDAYNFYTQRKSFAISCN